MVFDAKTCGFVSALAAILVSGGLRAQSCPVSGSERGTIANVEQRLELRLRDGRLLRLAGVDPVFRKAPDAADLLRQPLAAGLAGRDISFQLASGAPDRWGRRPAFVFLAGGPGDAGGLAARAIAAGMGRYLAEPAAHPCRGELLSAESKAREAKLGLWADPYYAVLAVDDQAAFAERYGTIVVAEGRLTAVEPGPYRTKLRFAAQGSNAGYRLAASILPRVMKVFEAQGVTFPSLIGRNLRLRGLLDLRFGPQIEQAGPDDVELLAAPSAAAH